MSDPERDRVCTRQGGRARRPSRASLLVPLVGAILALGATRAPAGDSPMWALRADGTFSPLVDVCVGQVEEVEYVAVWQALDDFETRYVGRPENAVATEWIRDHLAGLGLEVEYHEYEQTPTSFGTKRNVIATHPGASRPDEVVYVTAHFDSINRRGDQAHAPGADDNASGVAAVLETARVLSAHRFARTIRFALFNGEELGLVGSEAYVEDVARHEDIVGVLNLDMIAYAGVDPLPPDIWIFYADEETGELASLLTTACETYLPDDLEPRPALEIVDASDHQPFLDHGQPALLIHEAEVWGEDFCPWYHSTDDRIERYPRDYPTHVTMATLAATAQLAEPWDCNENGRDDAEDLALGSSTDCDLDGLPDECAVRWGLLSDEDGDGVPDECASGVGFLRCDARGDGTLDLADAIDILAHLFRGGVELPCQKAADCDDSGSLDLTDAIRLLVHLFAGGAAPAPPFPGCGPDPTPDGLTCEAFCSVEE